MTEHPPGSRDRGVTTNKAGSKWDCRCLGLGMNYVAEQP